MSRDGLPHPGSRADEAQHGGAEEALVASREALAATRDIYLHVRELLEDTMVHAVIVDALIDSHPDPAALLEAHRAAALKMDALMMTDERAGLGALQKCAGFQARIAARLNGRAN